MSETPPPPPPPGRPWQGGSNEGGGAEGAGAEAGGAAEGFTGMPEGEESGPERVRGLARAGVFVLVVAGIVAAAALLSGNGATTGGEGSGDTDGPTASTELTRALQDVLDEIDRAERAMIGYQDTVERITEGQRPPDAEQTAAAAAREAVDELQNLRSNLTGQQLGGEQVQPAEATRDTYVEHLDAWVDHLEGVAEDPSSALVPTPDPGTFREINSTAVAFAAQLRRAVPDDAPEDLRSLARTILERGFSGSGGATPGGQLVSADRS